MKKFSLLLALVLTAGVVHAQQQEAYTPNFGNRAKLRIAEKLDAVFPSTSTNSNFGWDMNDANLRLGGGKLYWASNYANNSDVEIITANSLNTKLNGRNLLDVFENFVIRTYDFENYNGGGAVSYAVRFLDANNNLVTELRFWSDDVKIAPLRGIANKSESEINSIRKVVVRGNSGNGQVRIAEAYFISALPSTIDYTDKDGIDIGNAYIDPSYLIRSNRIWVDINDNDRSFYINLAAGTEFATLSFSLPYKTGIDMTDVTVVATDFFRSASPFNRCNYSNVRREMYNNANNTERLVRKLYNSRFNGPFYDENNYDALPDLGYPEKAMKHINDIHWEAFEYTTTELRRIWCQNICFTKNKIKARVTRKEMEPNDWTNQPEGFRNSDYPVRPYYREYYNWSDVVRGWWRTTDLNVFTDLSRFDKMRIIGSPNTEFRIRYATSRNGESVTAWEPELHVKTDAHGEANIDLDIYPNFYLQAIHFDGLDVDGIRENIGNSDTDATEMSDIRKTHYVNDIELFEGEGRLVKLVGSNSPNEAGNMYHVWNDDNNYQWQYGTIVRWATNQIAGQSKFEEHYNENLSNGALIWGTVGLYPENYADLTGYKAIRVYGTGSVRFVFNTTQNGYAKYGEKAKTTATTNQDVVLEIGNKGYAEVDISNYEYFHLNGIKVPWGGNANVTDIELVEDEEADYILYGNGSCYEQDKAPIDQSVWDAVNDPTAKVIDVRARCNNMQVPFDNGIFGDVEHLALPKTANPNVLYIERTSQFRGRKVGEHEQQKVENNKPVVDSQGNPVMETVDDFDNVNFITPSNQLTTYEFTSNKIELTDGYSFYAPMKIKADEATYTRTFNNANVVNSIILPFAVEAGNDTEKKSAGFYETNVTLKSTTNEGMVGILEEQNVNKGDWLLQFTKKTGTTEPNTPYLYAITSGTGENVFQGVPTVENKVIIPETPDVEVAAHLNMTNYDDATTNAKEGYYMRGVYEGTYMEDILFYGANGTLYRTPYMTVTPFRTIIKSPVPVLDPSTPEYVDYKDSQSTYFTSNTVKVVLAFDPNDESMDINSLVADGIFAEDEPIYNLAGQRVNTFDKGIYIVGGKKILVK